MGFCWGERLNCLVRPPGYACVRAVADGQYPDEVARSAGTDGTAGAMTDAAVEQGAAEDLGGGGQGGGEPGAGAGDRCMFHS